MSWSSPRTWTTGEIVTAAILNAHVRDNLLETGVGKVTAQGDTLYATAANALARLPKGTALQYLRMNAGATAPEWGTLSGDFTWIRKATTETVNGSSTLQDDDELALAVTADRDYLVECALAITSGSTPDWKFAWTLTNMTWDGTYEDGIGFGSNPGLISTQAIASATGRAVAIAAAATSILWRATFLIHAGSSGGTLKLQWAQNTSDPSNTSVLKNSWLRYRELGAT